MKYVVTAAEMRALDGEVIAGGVPGAVLMESAGRQVVEVMAQLVAIADGAFAIFAGPGSNGGDGYVIARHLHNRGGKVRVFRCVAESAIKGDAKIHFAACVNAGVVVHDALSQLFALQPDEVIVDALFGTGLSRKIEGKMADLIARMNDHRGLKIAVDVPSGLDSDRGTILGACVRADHTVTFAFLKRGLVSAPGFAWAGQIHVVDIGIPVELAEKAGVSAELLEEDALDRVAAARDPNGHKGLYGHLLILGGSAGKMGAALLAGRSALRTGVGLCTVATPDDVSAFDPAQPELMNVSYALSDPWVALGPVIAKMRALAIGPGMPTDSSMRSVIAKACADLLGRGQGVVLDADALNHLAEAPDLIAAVAAEGRAKHLVLTPHPGEAGRLLKKSNEAIQDDRIASALELARRFGCVTVLKGARTVLAHPDGRLAFCDRGNPGLATGGTGDVLTGIVGALLAQGFSAWDAAKAAVFLHAASADRLAERIGTQGFFAHEVADTVPLVIEARRKQLPSWQPR